LNDTAPGWSLGWRSHFLALAPDARLFARPAYLVVRMPDNPTYYWGNFLLTPQVPMDADLPLWLARAHQEITAHQPLSDHVAVGVDGDLQPARLPSWKAAGFEFHENCTLVLGPEQLRQRRVPREPGIAVRRLRLPQETDAALQVQLACDDGDHEPGAYREFRERVMQRAARLDQAGQGHWFGAWVGDQLVADCGLVYDRTGAGIGRFQNVETHPACRRRGACTALVEQVCRFAFDTLQLPRLVMCADPDDVAIGIYESLGFCRDSTHWLLQRRPPRDRR